MMDFLRARRVMVDTQIRTMDVTDADVLDAFLDVPREAFVPPSLAALAYLDRDLMVEEGPPARFLMQPMVLARLIQLAEIGRSDRVLDVGAATGYSAALLARLAGAVVALESSAALASEAARKLSAVDTVRVVAGPLPAGRPEDGPYDAIVLEGAVEEISPELFRQLAPGGRLVAIVGQGRIGRGSVFVKSAGDVAGRTVFDVTAAPLPGFAKRTAFAF
jgi:protein-L-isoaspartate(D-aspartate) O-methyltransferase